MDLHEHMITRRVLTCQHHENTRSVFNGDMKTIGERMRQARDARGMSQEELANKVGYKRQSAIGNLENRATGSGGDKIEKIASVLRVPLQWLMAGPDTGEVPYVESQYQGGASVRIASHVQDAPATATQDASLEEAMQLFRRLNTSQRVKAIDYMQSLAQEGATRPETDRDRSTVPYAKAA